MVWKELICLKRIRSACSLGILSIAISGCSDTNLADLEQYVQQIKSRPAKPISPLPEIKSYKTFTYQAAVLRNPFIPTVVELPPMVLAPEGGVRPDRERHREALENYSLDSLKMVGILQQGETIWAIIRAPDGVFYRVGKGSYLGQNYGKITRVSEEKIEITEIVPGKRGDWLEHQTMLALDADIS